jgi:hypothetical protein
MPFGQAAETCAVRIRALRRDVLVYDSTARLWLLRYTCTNAVIRRRDLF